MQNNQEDTTNNVRYRVYLRLPRKTSTNGYVEYGHATLCTKQEAVDFMTDLVECESCLFETNENTIIAIKDIKHYNVVFVAKREIV